MKEARLESQLESIQQMEQELLDAKATASNNQAAYDQLSQLISQGQVRQDGKGDCFVVGAQNNSDA